MLFVFLVYMAYKLIRMVVKCCLLQYFCRNGTLNAYKFSTNVQTILVLEISNPSYLFYIPIKTFNFSPADFVGLHQTAPTSLQVQKALFKPKLFINWGTVSVKELDKPYSNLQLPNSVPISIFHKQKLNNLIKTKKL